MPVCMKICPKGQKIRSGAEVRAALGSEGLALQQSWWGD